jgi:hypothetical protein
MMTIRESLAALHAMQTFRRLPLAKDGKPYGPGFFAKRDWEGALVWPNRRVALRLGRLGKCIRCATPVGDLSGDHIIPTSKGGPLGAENYMPLCRSCNASKGDRDLLDWWYKSDRWATELPDDVIIAYCRLMFVLCQGQQRLDDPATPSMIRACDDFARAMPDERYYGAVQQVVR